MKLDISNKNLQRIDVNYLNKLLKNENTNEQQIEIILLDNNSLSKLEGLDKFFQLKHLSLTNNRLVEIKLISKLSNLQFVNLLNNSLTHLNAFKDLKYLTWLNVSGNQIKSLDGLKTNISLEYIDASDNSINSWSDLSALNFLETLNLNSNEITSLELAPISLNRKLKHLFISGNAIEDLNEISYLVQFDQLECLSINNNPCVAFSSERIFNHRPFVVNWCLSLFSLDGLQVTQKEYLKAEWLYSQGKGRYYRPGQHLLLVDYLIKVCPFISAESLEEEVRLSKILEKKETYQSEFNHEEPFKRVDQVEEPFTLVTHLNRTVSFNISNSISSINNKTSKNHDTATSPNPNSYFSTSEINLIDDINLSSSGSTFDGDLDDNLDIDAFKLYGVKKSKSEMLGDQDHTNKSRYEDYDSRPIKPLDKNMLDKQLSEFNEVPVEEMEKLKLRTIQHIRAKTIDSALKLPQQKSFTRTPPSKKLSFNSNQAISNNQSKPQTAIKLRRKTLEEPKSNRLSPTKLKTKPTINQRINSPKPTTSNYLSHLGQTSSIVAATKLDTNKNVVNNRILFSNKKQTLPTKSQQMSTKKIAESDDDSKMNDSSNEDDITIRAKQADTTTNTNNSTRTLTQIKHSEIHSRIQKQRQEMLLSKQKSLNEFKNQLRLQEEAKKLETKTKINLTFEDQCATKIQSAWRGYSVRKAQKQKTERDIKFKNILNHLDLFRRNLSEISNDHKNFKIMYTESIETMWKVITSFTTHSQGTKSKTEKNFEDLIKSKIEPIENSKSLNDSNESEIKQENLMLKHKILLLEERCASLEDKLYAVLKQQIHKDTTDNLERKSELISDSTDQKLQPKILIYPPLRVRLQKLNEKRVALKWAINPKNALIELAGYNIYINGKLCGQMGPNDNIASINGINQEGEYKIFIRSYYANIESEDSNEVVTRVKRKQTANNKSESDENNQSILNASNEQISSKNQKDSSNEQIKYKSKQTKLDEEIDHLKSSSDSVKANKICPVSDRKDLWDPMNENARVKFQLNNFNPSFMNNKNQKPSPTKSDQNTDSSENNLSKSAEIDGVLNASNTSSASTVSSTSNSKTTTTNEFLKPSKSNSNAALSLADFINSVKFSTSEPNLSFNNNSNAKTNNTNICSLIRQSISFNEDADLEEKLEFGSKKENLNETDENKSDSRPLKNHVSNGKIFSQVQNVKTSN